jgi:hypothetical protein
MKKFSNPCCRCGFCCLITICPVGRVVYGNVEQCPALSFEGHVASCSLAGSLIPVGDGCCIKARAYKNGKQFNFASLPREFKRRAVQDLLRRGKN